MKITAIKAQQKRADRVSIFIDGAYCFSLTHAQLLDERLRIGQEVSDKHLTTLQKASDFGKLYERVLNYLSIRPRSQQEVKDYCRRKKIDPADCQEIISRLVARRYVDDSVFARAWVESRRLGKKTSRRKLYMELKQKGVAESLIQEAVEQGGFDERESLEALITKKRRIARFQDDQKLIQYLVRQGFRYADVVSALQTSNDPA